MIDLAKLPACTCEFIEHGAPEGQRQQAAFDASCQLRDAGATEAEALALVEQGAVRCGLELDKARSAVKSAFSRSPREPVHKGNGKSPGAGKKIVAAYDYTNETGKLLFQCVRYSPKDFRQRQPDGRGGFVWNLKGVKLALYRLPEIVKASEVWVVEGEKDADSLAALGFCATCNPMGAGKWRPTYSERLRGKSVVVIADKDVAGRDHAEKVARSLHGVGVHCKVLELPGEGVKDASDFVATFADKTEAVAKLRRMADTAAEYQPMPTRQPTPDAMRAAIADARPKIRLPGDDRLGSDFATELGERLRDCDIFLRNDEVCILTDNELHRVDPQKFRTWIEDHVICYRMRSVKDTAYDIDVTMRDDEARCVLASPQFASALRVVRRVNHARLPILRNDGTIELLPEGYDLNSQTLTASNVTYPEDMPLQKAVETLNDLLSEFVFADGERSKAVAIAAMVGLFAAQLLPDKCLRPCFIFLANAEGAGKSLLADCCIVPACGEPPTGCKSKEDDEIRKLLLTAIREARTIIKFDNLKGHLSSEALEGFLTATTVSDRKLGVNEYITGDNLATVFITGNGLTVSPDQRRRSLFVELHQPAERPEDREFKRPLDVPILLTVRPKLLAALWSIVRHWDAQGRPVSTRPHSAFPSWAKIIGGIVEAAGFGCPLATANVAATADKDGDDMRALVEAMTNDAKEFTFADVAELAKGLELFEGVLDFDKDGALKPKARSIFGNLLRRYDHRLVGCHHFIIAGKGHSRRYRLETVTQQGQQGQQGIPAKKGKALHAGDQPPDLADLATMQPETTPAATAEGGTINKSCDQVVALVRHLSLEGVNVWCDEQRVRVRVCFSHCPQDT